MFKRFFTLIFMRYTYLLLNFFTILIPLLRSFEPKLKFYTQWRYFFPAMGITAIFFLVWDYFKTAFGVWGFNADYLLGVYIFNLPLEELLFFITVPYACVFIYETLTYFVRKQILPLYMKYFLWAFGILSIPMAFVFYNQAYTFSVFLFAIFFMPLLTKLLNTKQLDNFLLTFLISLIPMFIVNGLLTGLPVVVYNDEQNLGIRLGTIPVEDFLYNALLLAMNIGLFEWFRNRGKRTSAKV